MILNGNIVRLRPLVEDDAEITLRWRQSDRARFLKRTPKTVQQQREWIVSRATLGDLNFVIEYLGTPVGAISIVDINREYRRCEMGRELIGEREIAGTAPVVWETELLLCDYIFGELGMHQIHGDVMVENTGMIKVRMYLGYHQDGILRDFYVYDGIYKDTVLLSLMDSEYQSVCRPTLKRLIDFCS